MTTISIEKAEKELADLVKRALAGEEIVISDGTGPGVKLAPLTPASPSYRGRGMLKGKIKVSDEDLFGPLPDDELKRWWGEDK
ncbi:MAG: type II toxin-antitoxin system Phd/YefM family antitoxin [Hyphomicrobiaceae bacterium]